MHDAFDLPWSVQADDRQTTGLFVVVSSLRKSPQNPHIPMLITLDARCPLRVLIGCFRPLPPEKDDGRPRPNGRPNGFAGVCQVEREHGGHCLVGWWVTCGNC